MSLEDFKILSEKRNEGRKTKNDIWVKWPDRCEKGCEKLTGNIEVRVGISGDLFGQRKGYGG